MPRDYGSDSAQAPLPPGQREKEWHKSAAWRKPERIASQPTPGSRAMNVRGSNIEIRQYRARQRARRGSR